MMRRYDDPVEVRRGALDDDRGPDGSPRPGPEQFLWRGRLWKVRSVLAHRVGADAPDASPDRELWRVRAGRGGLESDGVFDLSFDEADGSWQLVGSQD